jgi:tetratricopeptide (TPR) repeat protein
VHYLREAGLRATLRSALEDARGRFEQALGALEALPESPSTLEQAFEIRLELRRVLHQLGEVRQGLERLREAEALAERLNDDNRRARVCAIVTNIYSLVGELDEALASGTRALAIARVLGDLELRILTTTYLAQAWLRRTTTEASTSGWSSLPSTT